MKARGCCNGGVRLICRASLTTTTDTCDLTAIATQATRNFI